MKTCFAMGVLLATAACGGSTSNDSSPATGGVDAGLGGGGGSGGSGGGSGGSVGGSGGSVGGSGGSVGGSGGSVGGSGGSGGVTSCLGLGFCECKSASATCQVFSEACFCPCGVEPCTPDCDCICAGGKYLGCGPKDVMQPGALEGIWLVGWSGGANHYSWVRFNADYSADVLDAADLPANLPLWPCSGKGNWLFSAKLYNVHLTLPAGCSGMLATDLTFESFQSPSGYAKGAILQAQVTTQPNGFALEAYKFGPSQCDAAMTSCKSPF